MALFATKYSDSTEHEIMEINNFRRQTLQLYLNVSLLVLTCLCDLQKFSMKVSSFKTIKKQWSFKKSFNVVFLVFQFLDGRSSWATLISAFRILVENDDDRHFVVYNEGLQMCFEVRYRFFIFYCLRNV